MAMRSYGAVAALLMLVAIFGCRWSGNSNPTTEPTAAKPQVSRPGEDAEAKNQLQEFLTRQHASVCGDSYYIEKVGDMSGVGIFQYRNASIVITRVEPVSEADRLNGIEWRGLLTLAYPAYRRFVDGQWTQWQNNPRTAEYDFQVVKRSSGWSIDNHLNPTTNYSTRYQKVNCSQLPPG